MAAALAAFLLGATAPVLAATSGPAPRIVSLIPSLTEDLFAIGAGPQVVGVSQFTDYPAAAAKLPAVGSFASVDAEKIRTLHPDVVVGIRAQNRLVADVRRLGIPVVLLDNDGYDDIFADITALGRVSGHVSAARDLNARLRRRTSALTRTVDASHRPRVFFVLGVTPIFTVGDRSYVAHLISLAGGRNATGPLRDAYPRYSAEALVALQPDVIVGDAQSGLAGALTHAPWNALRAVRDRRVYILPNADILERPGPRYNAGLAWLIARLQTHA